jgi:hypothetical protein
LKCCWSSWKVESSGIKSKLFSYWKAKKRTFVDVFSPFCYSSSSSFCCRIFVFFSKVSFDLKTILLWKGRHLDIVSLSFK